MSDEENTQPADEGGPVDDHAPDDTAIEAGDAELPEEAPTGEPETEGEEVASRTADEPEGEESADVFTRTFNVSGAAPFDLDGYDHEANKLGTRQDAIQRGLHPTGDVSDATIGEAIIDRASVTYPLTYTVPVTPAHLDDGFTYVADPTATDDEDASDEAGVHDEDAKA